ncbi:TonB-dependent receptor [Rhodanobacter sp. Si-c]|uniref:TonB-dependent receptor n=1 Tax=Rhodanobacter lycopersici TaxID=3162487 RepID=A0ABV3QGT0_9GAMM
MNIAKFRNSSLHGARLRRTALALAIAAGAGMTGQALAQATTGSIFGTAPVSTGETVRIVNNQTGLTREVAVDSTGRFGANQLPVGNYTVSLMQGGNVVASHDHVQVSVSGGAQVPFTAAEAGQNVQNLSSVTVTANSVPAIDVSSTRQTSVITSQDLKVLPVARDAEAIAMLAPGVSGGNAVLGTGPAGTPLLSFGGNSVMENSYYINGFNTTDPVGNTGGIALPYFAIAEQQTITSGYGAEYGRSTGGVISQVGQRGGNDFHAGVYVTMQPGWAENSYDNTYYGNALSTTPNKEWGNLYQYKRQNSDWSTLYDAYLSGPLIKDKLFFYITGEAEHDHHDSVTGLNLPSTNAFYRSTGSTLPKFYGKLDWNINDNNTLEYTYVNTKNETQFDNLYNWNYATRSTGGFNAVNNPINSDKFKVNILKYTSYITDNLTLSVLAGKMKSTYFDQFEPYAGFDPDMPGLASIANVNPNVPGYTNVNNNIYAISAGSPGHKSTTNNFRLDLDWKLGDHDLRFGIDNQRSEDIDDGTITPGPGYYWNFYNPVAPISAQYQECNNLGQCIYNPRNFAGGASGYYAAKVFYGGTSSFVVQQKAQYIEDNWQVTPNLLLNLGLRNDQFTNYNGAMVPYIRQTKPQWAPRLGFSWDIFGDSSAKLYGNAGRYYLAIPSGMGTRMAGANNYSYEYYTYGSINAEGIPQTIAQIPTTATPYSADGEYGQPKDPRTASSADLKPMYQDEYVLGFQKALHAFGQSLVWTSQATYSKMNNVIDDTSAFCSTAGTGYAVTTQPTACASGYSFLPPDADPSTWTDDYLVNPGRSNVMRYQKTDGSYGTFVWNPHTAQSAAGAVVGFPAAFRKYYSLEESLERPWDGKWMAKIDYVFSKSYGTTEGPTESSTHQVSSSSGAAGGYNSGGLTEAWDYPELMQYANGELPNSHRHTFKAYGTYAITPEWLVSGTYIIQSGAPITCLGYFGPGQTNPIGYGEAYHWCGGHAAPPGEMGHTPWTHQLNLSVNYVPAWAGKHLTLQLQLHNVFNEQNVTAYSDFYGATNVAGGADPTYKEPWGVEDPRYAEFSVKYDW